MANGLSCCNFHPDHNLGITQSLKKKKTIIAHKCAWNVEVNSFLHWRSWVPHLLSVGAGPDDTQVPSFCKISP